MPSITTTDIVSSGLITDQMLSPTADPAERFYEGQASQDGRVPESSQLLALPVEIREQIYSYVFHAGPKSRIPCRKFRLRLDNLGCQCGNGISLANRQLYNETRSLFYRVGDFIFDSPVTCMRFVHNIRHHISNIRSLDISYQDTFSQSSIIRDILAMFTPNSKFHTLRLRTVPLSLSLVPDSPPIYFPSFQRYFPGEFYDLSFRPVRHPLAKITSIRSLTVVGHPGSGEIDEALLKLRLKLEDIAFKEHEWTESTEVWQGEGSDWEFTLEIGDKSS